MDPVTLGAVLLAIVSGVAGEAGGRLWDKVSALVRPPFRHGGAAASSAQPAQPGQPAGSGVPAGAAPLASAGGVAELTALAGSPQDKGLALALAHALIARAGADAEFGRTLGQWWEETSELRVGEGAVINTISGGTQSGPVLQGRDFTGLTFGATSPVPPPAAQ
jgi:hypothetical protein